jgi:two-component system cell cycle response regulator DivK
MAQILVVEDDEANQELVSRFLRRCGHKVLLAEDGASAVEAAVEHIPDLIIMDLSLPGMDGWEAAGLIRSKPETAHVPIIALTAHKLSGDVSKALGAGINAYETKPVVYQRLMKKIEELCSKDY